MSDQTGETNDEIDGTGTAKNLGLASDTAIEIKHLGAHGDGASPGAPHPPHRPEDGKRVTKTKS